MISTKKLVAPALQTRLHANRNFYKSAPLILRRRPFGQAFAFVCKFLELVWFFHARGPIGRWSA
jgi:hypothetical protein